MRHLVSNRDPLERAWQLGRDSSLEKPRKKIADPFRSTDRVEANVADGWSGIDAALGVGNVDDGVIQADAMRMKNELDDVVDLPLCSELPLSGRGLGQTGCTLKHEPVLLGPVQHPVVELGVGCNLEIKPIINTFVTMLEIGKAITVRPARLLHIYQLNLG